MGGSARPDGATRGWLRSDSAAGRWVLLTAVLGSAIALLDGTAVNVALPAIGRDLDARVAGLQWTLSGYLLTLSAFILLGGSLGDRFGRRRIFVIGVVWFAAASLLCGLAPSLPVLVAARALQGVGGALLTPGSLAIIQSSFHPDDRGQAIGAWSGFTGIAAALGPLVGGWLVGAFSWRWIFLLNVPLAIVVVAVALRHVPESLDPDARGQRLDFAGAALVALGLAGVTFALVEAPEARIGAPGLLMAGLGGLMALAIFGWLERRSSHPVLPLSIFGSRQFSGANLVTFAVYAALGGVFFLLVVHLQQVLGYSPTQAGAAMLPSTLLMLLLSARAGKLAQRIGPRLPMTLGPLGVAAGVLLMSRIDAGSEYLTAVLPAVVVFGLGLALTVAPLTTTVLAAVDERHAGIASGVNNAVARVAGLLAVATLPLLAGLGGEAYLDPDLFSAGFRAAMLWAAGLAAAGGGLAWLAIRDEVAPPAEEPSYAHCAVGGPPARALGRNR